MYTPYATAMNTIFTTFMYGMALPVLFPIAILTFVNIMIAERIGLAKLYQLPPQYDGQLNE